MRAGELAMSSIESPSKANTSAIDSMVHRNGRVGTIELRFFPASTTSTGRKTNTRREHAQRSPAQAMHATSRAQRTRTSRFKPSSSSSFVGAAPVDTFASSGTNGVGADGDVVDLERGRDVLQLVGRAAVLLDEREVQLRERSVKARREAEDVVAEEAAGVVEWARRADVGADAGRGGGGGVLRERIAEVHCRTA